MSSSGMGTAAEWCFFLFGRHELLGLEEGLPRLRLGVSFPEARRAFAIIVWNFSKLKTSFSSTLFCRQCHLYNNQALVMATRIQ